MITPQIKLLMMLGLTLALTACTFTVTPAPAGPVPPTQSVAAVPTDMASTSKTPIPTAEPSTETTPPTVAPATETPSTAVQPTAAPTKRPTATRPPIEDPTVPGFGSPNGLEGRITLPGYTGSVDAPVFEDAVAFRLIVFDPAVGTADGNGITAVTLTVIDPNGNTVLDARVEQAPYCAFGATAEGCAVWQFSAQNLQWPNGGSVCAGEGYTANMFVEAVDANKSNANWGFVFAIASPAGQLSPCQ